MLPNIQTTVFETTPPMPSDYIAVSVFQLEDFGSITKFTTNGNIPVRISIKLLKTFKYTKLIDLFTFY